ncbi:MAG: DUF998 domain-containing protein [Candidatus Methanomethylicaceae archaeon]
MRASAFFGIGAIISLYTTIALAISISPWFSWIDNALSDLGNLRYESAPIFNVGLLITGLLLILYSFISLRDHAPKTAYLLAFTGFAMQLVGLLCENYGIIHFYVSVILFISLPIASMAYFIEKRCYLTWLVFVAVPFWMLHFQGGLFRGVAIPEILSSFVVLPWLIATLIRVWKE